MIEFINKFLVVQGVDAIVAKYIANTAIFLCIILFSLLAYFVTKKILLKFLGAIITKSKTKWDDMLLKHKVLERLILVIPALVVFAFAPTFPSFQEWIQRIAFCLIILGIILALDKLLNAVNDIYSKYEISKFRPIKGYLQILKIAAYIIGAIIVISVLMDRSPLILLGGIGAATAVLLMIFQNTILGFVASLQLTENDMVRLGDWIEMPKHGANGEVTEITLHTVKVQNWDNTITTIPTYALVSESFKNWRAMQEAGGRRIERALYIDINSIKFCKPDDIRKYENMPYIQDYLSKRNAESITNIGIFRAYLEAYLANHPIIHESMTRMVRQLAPTEHGLPVEIYAFTKTTAWVEYENIQSDIFDHILAVLPEFDLRICQLPTGYDFSNLNK